jgi:hypothetical protein
VILSDEEIQEEERDDGAPIEILEQYFEARGWACERTAEGEIVASATGSWAQYELRGVWRPEDQVLQFLAFPDIKVAAEKRSAIFEALSLINEQLWLGHFEMWSGSGLVVFRHSTILDTREDEGLSLEQAEAIVEAAVEECERFYPVFQFVLWGGKSPGEAIAAASSIRTAKHDRGSAPPGTHLDHRLRQHGPGHRRGLAFRGHRPFERGRHPPERASGRGSSHRSGARRGGPAAQARDPRVQAAQARRGRSATADLPHLQDGGRLDPRGG